MAYKNWAVSYAIIGFIMQQNNSNEQDLVNLEYASSNNFPEYMLLHTYFIKSNI